MHSASLRGTPIRQDGELGAYAMPARFDRNRRSVRKNRREWKEPEMRDPEFEVSPAALGIAVRQTGRSCPALASRASDSGFRDAGCQQVVTGARACLNCVSFFRAKLATFENARKCRTGRRIAPDSIRSGTCREAGRVSPDRSRPAGSTGNDRPGQDIGMRMPQAKIPDRFRTMKGATVSPRPRSIVNAARNRGWNAIDILGGSTKWVHERLPAFGGGARRVRVLPEGRGCRGVGHHRQEGQGLRALLKLSPLSPRSRIIGPCAA